MSKLYEKFAKKWLGFNPFEKYPEIIKCPVCGREYKPKYKRKEDAPEGTIWREQHLSGICSEKCWRKMVKGVSHG